jgi:hypothetical protein
VKLDWVDVSCVVLGMVLMVLVLIYQAPLIHATRVLFDWWFWGLHTQKASQGLVHLG